jgi:hypothetical protein
MLAVAALAGCSRSPLDQARKGLDSIHSWAASTQMVGERWLQGAVPSAYVRRTLQSFGRKVVKERGKVASGSLPTEMKRYLLSGFDSTSLAIDSLRVMVDRGERGEAARLVSSLSSRAHATDSMKARIHEK